MTRGTGGTPGKITERVRRLLDLAEHPNTGEEEAALASAHAAALMLRYGLVASAVRRGATGRAEHIDGIEFEVSNRGGHARERCWALHLICDALGCKGAQRWTGVKGRGIRGAKHVTMTVIGPEPVLDSLRVLLPSLTLQMENQVAPALRRFTATRLAHLTAKDHRARATADFRRAFYVGFGSGVSAKLRARVTEMTAQVKGTSAELVLLDRTPLVQAEFTRRFPGLRRARTTPLDADGYTTGQTAGHQADLNDHTLDTDPTARRSL
ncbi:DUF2786 domain-containing protein [Sphaerisporangium sp. TRM90804]|uniref:DUF2786 domain-containing protein n=1 Tax=Sphaerisporangium sp. TRM90804 TaxID=3031113 RepID=UPI002449FB2E|nr:DUF2786 domain-containing protein [Sphaerisporangium sp. TRM90804]MDH2424175.1 DUF2786 domain-containing protein [Sphaerisporangium sp. TRM90804]